MINDFINQTLDFLDKSDINFHYPQICPVDLNSDGTHRVLMSFINHLSQPQINKNIVMNFMIFFMLFDVLVDTLIPAFEGKSFKQRYQNLPSGSDDEIILKEMYRIMKIFRNAIVHSKGSIDIGSNRYSINYYFHSTNFQLDIEKKTIGQLYSLIMIFIKVRNNINSYILSLLRNYYDDISITNINDEFGSNLFPISNGLRLKKIRRYRINNPKYQVDNEKLIIDKYKIHEMEKSFSGAEYIIPINGILYMIPDEVLGEGGEIEISKIDEWKYEENIFCPRISDL